MFPMDPTGPFVVEGGAVNILKLSGEVSPAVFGSVEPPEKLFRTVLVREIAEKSGSIEIRIDPHLKIDRLPLGFNSDKIIKVAAVVHHRPEHHLIITTQY